MSALPPLPQGALPPRAGPATGAYAVARSHRLRPWRALAAAAGTALGLALAGGLAGGFAYRDLAAVPYPPAAPGAGGRAARLPDGRRLARELAAEAPRGVYIVVDTAANRLYLMRGGEVLREAACSTGTGGVLVDPASGRRWVFDTPRGTHRVQAKVEHPVWNKPDWAFVEDGLPIPKSAAERVDTYSLGDYALYLGDGYLIHGTLYQRLLGRSVTHGCVRLGDEDLQAVYAAAPIGTRVYIY
jgi:lipoprotein-anchoring transpeptidase ErfK/SrfK